MTNDTINTSQQILTKKNTTDIEPRINSDCDSRSTSQPTQMQVSKENKKTVGPMPPVAAENFIISIYRHVRSCLSSFNLIPTTQTLLYESTP